MLMAIIYETSTARQKMLTCENLVWVPQTGLGSVGEICSELLGFIGSGDEAITRCRIRVFSPRLAADEGLYTEHTRETERPG